MIYTKTHTTNNILFLYLTSPINLPIFSLKSKDLTNTFTQKNCKKQLFFLGQQNIDTTLSLLYNSIIK